ncbi:MAG: TolC family protein [Bacteroidetes bacterium]|nr:TolC family protein [Bacteroidota bacterium]
MKTVFTICLISLFQAVSSLPLKAQEKISPVDAYVRYGLENNLVLKQKNITLDQALVALKMANGMFSPSVTLLGNYTNGTGGRSISFPVGDLLNPVYSTLNQLTASQNFPTIENVNTNFFPRDFYDVRARTSMPLFNTDLIYNRKIKDGQVLLQEMEIRIYQRELVRNIKTAYYNYLSARESLSIYESALERAKEGKRVNESLLTNGKGLPAYILRSESEIETINGQMVEAERSTDNAKMYFNFLLNRDRSAEIETEFVTDLSNVTTLLSGEVSTQQREEVVQLQRALNINQQVVKMNKLFWSPRLSGFIDLGAQAENLEYNRNARYQLTGLQLEMLLFSGFNNKQKINQSELQVKNVELNVQLTQQQLHLAANVSLNTLISAYQNYKTSLKQLEAARSYQRLIEKGYKEGVNTFLESVDARNQLTGAELLLRLNLYKVLIAEAGLERETATYQLN